MSGLFRRFLPAARPARRFASSRRTSPKARLLLRALEDRLAPATFTVANANDAGAGSLRQAILDANANPGADAIAFDPGAFATAQTVSLLSPLPTLSGQVTVSGPGATLLSVRPDPSAAFDFGVFEVTSDAAATVTLSGLTATGGRDGGIVTNGGTLDLADVVVRGNQSTVRTSTGGGVTVYGGGTLVVRNSTVAGNTANQGGGICFVAGGSLVLENSTVSDNTATGTHGGGGLYFGGLFSLGTVGAGGLTVRNSTFSGNLAGSGAGIKAELFNGTLLIQNSTITANESRNVSPSAGVGGSLTVGGTQPGATEGVVLQSTIVAGNVALNGRPDLSVVSGVTVTADHSLIGVLNPDTTLAAGSADNLSGTAAAPLDPKLGPLANNGGPTPTHALLAGSPALNAGSNPAGLATDQRGSARVVGPAADIGAYEYKPLTVAGIEVNGGGAQRSMVRSLVVTFSGPVTFANNNPAAAFALTRISGGGGTVTLSAAVATNPLGQTVVTLTFTGGPATDPLTGPAGGPLSLADGRYQLTIPAGAAADAATGAALDGDANGVAGGAYASPPDTAGSGAGYHFGLYRKYGDASGNGVVDALDLTDFRGAFNSSIGDPRYSAAFDADGDGDIDAVDLSYFRANFGGGFGP